MRTHTALHLLCGMIFRDYGAQVTGGQMYPDHARMDFAIETFRRICLRDIEMQRQRGRRRGSPIKVY